MPQEKAKSKAVINPELVSQLLIRTRGSKKTNKISIQHKQGTKEALRGLFPT
ncbi:hypothetical protein RND71_014173 [Anisodus tanguticus]|uniref:Uncharacterized protein n=1 Tax=Anisodus tanguticus TaxID=243964 RepID=A0AAE1VDY0_9SOLA|nr:hypothetical protein RND71_014173 [Anisodus tanguticus]